LKFTETDERGIRIITKACLEKIVKKQSMHPCEPTPVHIVKGNNFENSNVTRTEMRLIKINMDPYASAVGSLMSAQL
jgi:hypothetical protein